VLGVGLAALGALVAIAFAGRAVMRVGRLAPPDRAELETSLKRGDDASVDRAVKAAFPDIAAELLAVRGDPSLRAAAAAALDEQLGDLDAELSAGRSVSQGAVRVALLAAGLGAVLELARDLSSGNGLVNALTAAGAGACAALISLELGRRAARTAEALRRDWDAVASAIDRHLGLLDAGEAEIGSSASYGERRHPGPRRSRGRGRI
jgi:hypothetical protein